VVGVKRYLLNGLWGLSFLCLGLSVYLGYVGQELAMFTLLWAFALTMMAYKLLNFYRIQRTLSKR
jgi:hypothetical protein